MYEQRKFIKNRFQDISPMVVHFFLFFVFRPRRQHRADGSRVYGRLRKYRSRSISTEERLRVSRQRSAVGGQTMLSGLRVLFLRWWVSVRRNRTPVRTRCFRSERGGAPRVGGVQFRSVLLFLSQSRGRHQRIESKRVVPVIKIIFHINELWKALIEFQKRQKVKAGF